MFIIRWLSWYFWAPLNDCFQSRQHTSEHCTGLKSNWEKEKGRRVECVILWRPPTTSNSIRAHWQLYSISLPFLPILAHSENWAVSPLFWATNIWLWVKMHLFLDFKICMLGLVIFLFINWLCPLMQGKSAQSTHKQSPKLSPAPPSLLSSVSPFLPTPSAHFFWGRESFWVRNVIHPSIHLCWVKRLSLTDRGPLSATKWRWVRPGVRGPPVIFRLLCVAFYFSFGRKVVIWFAKAYWQQTKADD